MPRVEPNEARWSPVVDAGFGHDPAVVFLFVAEDLAGVDSHAVVEFLGLT